MTKKQIYVITGGPGFGKTLLIEELRKRAYCCSSEFARDLVTAQLEISGEILPWKNPKLFQQEILNKRIAFFDSVPDDSIAFADRGIPDQIAFSRYRGFEASEILLQQASRLNYATQVFIAPPWPAIFQNDEIRTETYEEAVRIDEFIRNIYSELNYQIIELPLNSVKERVEFILENLNKLQNNGY